MSSPVIPADQWPEGSVALVWSAFGFGKWVVANDASGTWLMKRANLPMPAGHDWSVPIMRPSEQAPAIDLEQGLRDLYRAYVRLLESGRDRITSLGGDCDPVDVMEQTDIELRKVRDLLALIDGQAAKGEGVGNGR